MSSGADFEFEHPATGLAVGADRRPGDADAEAAGASCAWRVWYERHAGEATERRTVGAVTTRDAAVDAVLSCMRRVSDDAAEDREGCRLAALSTLAAGVSLHDPVPTADNSGGPVDEVAYARSWVERLGAEG